MQDPRNFQLSSRVNLDHLFGNQCDNTVREDVTPFKLVFYELIRTLHEVHQEKPQFTVEELNRLHSLLYGALEAGDMPFDDLKRIVRYMDKTVREGIYAGFIYSTTCLVSRRDIRLRVDRLLPPTVHRTAAPPKPRLFSSRTNLAAWLKKLQVAWSQLTTQEAFDMMSAVREYVDIPDLPRIVGISSPQKVLTYSPSLLPRLPFEIGSSSRARKWIDKQLHLIQVCPSVAFTYDEMVEWCSMIRLHHKDIAQVYLLEMLNHVRKRDPHAAHEALRKCFDYAMFRPNIRDAMFLPTEGTRRMGETDQRPLRYGPLLHARLCRIFGDKDTARYLISECVQQAQIAADNVCLKLAMVEMAAIEALPPSRADKQQLSGRQSHTADRSMRSSIKIMRMVESQAEDEADDAGGMNVSNDFSIDQSDVAYLMQQLTDCCHLLTAISNANQGDFTQGALDGVATAMSSTSGDDNWARARLLSDAATALQSSLRIQRGMWRAARSSAATITQCNYSDGHAPHHETESQAIAIVNTVYSYAAEGRWKDAMSTLNSTRDQFGEQHNWQASHHFWLCHHLISFDDAFRVGKWKDCDSHLVALEAFAPEEALLRRSLLEAQQGNVRTALLRLQAAKDAFDSSTTFIFQMRLLIQLSMLLAAESQWKASLDMLQGVREMAAAKGHDMLSTMALRRASVVQNMQLSSTDSRNEESPQRAQQRLEYILGMESSQLEKALVFIGSAKAAAERGDSGVNPIPSFGMARLHCQRAGYPLLEKIVLKDVAVWYNSKGDIARRDDACEQLRSLHEQYPGVMQWTLF